MPHVPDRHADHDLALVAASTTDDLSDAERAGVTDLLAVCADCRELAADLRALATATAALPVPPRRRDYRLTPDQAARLRPGGLRGLLATLASRRFAFAAPLGTAMATLGIVGLLVAALPGPFAGGGEIIEMASGPDTQAAPSDVRFMMPAPGPGDGGQPSDPQPADGTFDAIARALAQARGAEEVLVILGGTVLLIGLALLALRWLGRQLV